MKTYQLSVEIKLVEGKISDYSPKLPVFFKIEENLPVNIDAQKYVRQRIADELKKSFEQLIEEIDNKTEDKKTSQDPLTDNIVF